MASVFRFCRCIFAPTKPEDPEDLNLKTGFVGAKIDRHALAYDIVTDLFPRRGPRTVEP